MRASERPGKRVAWSAVAIAALAAVLMLALADGAMAKKRPFKTGHYAGRTSQAMHNGVALEVKKKKVIVTYIDFYTGCSVPMCEPSFAGISGMVKVKKVGAIAFGEGQKRVGTFDADGPGDEGFVIGYIKGKKAEGIASRGADGPDVDWTAKLDECYYGCPGQ